MMFRITFFFLFICIYHRGPGLAMFGVNVMQGFKDRECNFLRQSVFSVGMKIWNLNRSRKRNSDMKLGVKPKAFKTSGSYPFPLRQFSQYMQTHVLTHICRTHKHTDDCFNTAFSAYS